ncbi:glycosyl hydrolase [Ereboglobus luteus]|uniref:Glycosyl transferase family 2 n=1 Tax=Ereboglobus luteus TaxID=1796921 RepID=A0A2U8E4Y6_9BACT|nr:glycosyl hydrolase [Ereboglobus luteus]AWI09582.1 glycosyl transferase family 2 [Ereboglobus luteus]
MKRRDFIKLSSLAGVALAVPHSGLLAKVADRKGARPAGAGSLAEEFVNVPDSSRPGGYWWWIDGQVDKAGITHDLEEFAAKGIGTVLFVNSTNLGPADRRLKGVAFLSGEWMELYKHAVREADRLGIEFGVNLSGGWCMGGPWIEPRYSGRWFLQSRHVIEGPAKFDDALPLPGGRDGYDKVFNPPGYKAYIDLPLEKLDYRDTCVVAFRDDAGDAARFTDKERLEFLPAKTNRRDASNHALSRDVVGPTLGAWPAHSSDKPIAPENVVDLTSKVSADGRLRWDVPAGRWVIVRTGHRMTGSRLMIAPPEADGLSVDWLASKPVDIQFENIGKKFLEGGKVNGRNTLKYFCSDSFEDGFPNWTEDILKEFEARRGYDPRPYTPVMNGFIVGSAEISDRFLHDYRKTVADCMADRHYAYFGKKCHELGMEAQHESAGPSRSGTMCMDSLKNLGRADRPMGEFWMGTRHDEPGGLDPKLRYGTSRLEEGQNKVTKMVASAAHIYGKKTASAESFTTMRHWQDYPGNLKQQADRAFCEGINHFSIHTTTATKSTLGKPGYEYYAGTHFNPNVTWWHHAGAFLKYIGRSQHLLRQGLFVADVLYYNGDWAPNIVPPKRIDPSLGFGFDYDVCNAEVLLTRLSVAKDGRLTLPDGMSYRVLALPETDRMPVEVMEKIKALVKAGATITGPRPEKDPGMKNYPKCDAAVKKLASEVWGDCDGKNRTANKYGRGRVFWGVTLREILAKDGIGPDFACAENTAAADKSTGVAHASRTGMDFIHRSVPGKNGAEIYLVANQSPLAQTQECAFRVTGRAPEIWNAVDGTMRAAAHREERGRTVVSLDFAPFQSFFVVFPATPSALAQKARAKNFPQYADAAELSGAWTVKFDPAWGGPSKVEFAALEDWTKRSEPGIKYYSGSAFYTKRFDYKKGARDKDARVFIDLGTVRDIAGVKLNGHDFGTVWTSPWRVDVTDFIKDGANTLEIEVVNQWRNRLVGDAMLPEEKRITYTNIPVDPKKMPLLPSGLLGPVKLVLGT